MADELLPTGAIIHWDQTERRSRAAKPNRTDLFILVECSCRKLRWTKRSHIMDAKRNGRYTGLCYDCVVIDNGHKYGRPNLPDTRPPHWANAIRGPNNPQWKGGWTTKSGYIYIYMPDHPFANGDSYVAEHRLIMEKHLNRHLTPDEVVHHINGLRWDNRIENLEVLDKHKHHHAHKPPAITEIIQALLGQGE
jgi:hypothetical protein